jgi:hypothetical protein
MHCDDLVTSLVTAVARARLRVLPRLGRHTGLRYEGAAFAALGAALAALVSHWLLWRCIGCIGAALPASALHWLHWCRIGYSGAALAALALHCLHWRCIGCIGAASAAIALPAPVDAGATTAPGRAARALSRPRRVGLRIIYLWVCQQGPAVASTARNLHNFF